MLDIAPEGMLLRDDPCVDWGPSVEFRLTYEGELLAEKVRHQTEAPRAAKKHEIRKHFHKQLKRCWEIMPQLNGNTVQQALLAVDEGPPDHDIATLSAQYARNGYNFVPLVTKDLIVLCALDVLFLRREAPGSVINSGDMDNRLKTLFDALTMPANLSQLGGYVTPDADETPFFCLLEDDCVVTRLAVETDVLLEPINGKFEPNDARVVITVRLLPAGFDTSSRYRR